MPTTPPQGGTWWFGAICQRCGRFVVIAPDDSGGRPEVRFASRGTVILTCRSCGERGRYRATEVVRRRTDERDRPRT